MSRWDREDSQDNENSLGDALRLETCPYTSVQTRRMHTTTRAPTCKLCTGGVSSCPCRFVHLIRAPRWWQTLIVGDLPAWGLGGTGNLCTFHSVLL